MPARFTTNVPSETNSRLPDADSEGSPGVLFADDEDLGSALGEVPQEARSTDPATMRKSEGRLGMTPLLGLFECRRDLETLQMFSSVSIATMHRCGVGSYLTAGKDVQPVLSEDVRLLANHRGRLEKIKVVGDLAIRRMVDVLQNTGRLQV